MFFQKAESILYRYRWYFLWGSFLLHVMLFWPGFFCPDSQFQYKQALLGKYQSHHPVIMAYVWRQLSAIYPGPGTMYILQLLFLYTGLSFLMRSLSEDVFSKDRKNWIWFIFIFPWWPQILSYTLYVQKDTQFTLSFLAVGFFLAFVTCKKRPLSVFEGFLCFWVLWYGTSVKYQAQFVVPFFLYWMVMLWQPSWEKLRRWGLFLGLTVTFYSSLTFIEQVLVPVKKDSMSWQYVKLFDLAALSIRNQEDLIPEVFKSPGYTTELLHQTFLPFKVDPLIRQEKVLRKSFNAKDSQLLMKTWKKNVLRFPGSYVGHRWDILKCCLIDKVGFSHLDAYMQRWEIKSSFPQIIRGFHTVLHGIGFLFLSHLPTILLGVFYLGLSIYYRHASPVALPLRMFSLTALSTVSIFFFFSMAGAIRYTYLSVVLIHACHLWAFCLWQKARRPGNPA